MLQGKSGNIRFPFSNITFFPLKRSQVYLILSLLLMTVYELFPLSSLLQWLPLPLFAIYRVLLFLYIFAWLLVSAALTTPGGRWLVFLTNLSYLVLVLGTGAIAILCVVYTIVYYANRNCIQNLPKVETPIQLTYTQDNISWYVKLVWFLYISGSTLAVLVTIGYWALIYSCDSNGSNNNNTTSLTVNNTANLTVNNTTDSTGSCAPPSVLTVHTHGVNGLLALVDLFISRVPFQFLHFFYPAILTALYAFLNGIYFAAGGGVIYPPINYGENLGIAVVLVIVLALSPMPIYIIFFLLAWLRDVVYKKVACCFRDIRHMNNYNTPHPVVNGTNEKNPNEMVESEA